jgi:hypothetical protein
VRERAQPFLASREEYAQPAACCQLARERRPDPARGAGDNGYA